MTIEYHVAVGNSGIRRLVGEIISIDKSGVAFQYKQERSSKRLRIIIPRSKLILMKENAKKSEVIFHSAVYEITKYVAVTDVVPSDIQGLMVGKTRKGETLYFSQTEVTAFSLHSSKEKKKKVVKNTSGQIKPKGTKVKKPNW